MNPPLAAATAPSATGRGGRVTRSRPDTRFMPTPPSHLTDAL
ncbi:MULTISPECIES: hypothetical protein [Haloarcula]|nr:MULTISPECIES: hypothetical protein [Haloarcula]